MLHTWKGLKSRARTGPECFSACAMTGSPLEARTRCTLYMVSTPLSPPPMSTPEDSADPLPKFPQISLWNLKQEENKAGIGHDIWWKSRHPPHYQNSSLFQPIKHILFKRTVALGCKKRNKLPSNDFSMEFKREELVSIFSAGLLFV